MVHKTIPDLADISPLMFKFSILIAVLFHIVIFVSFTNHVPVIYEPTKEFIPEAVNIDVAITAEVPPPPKIQRPAVPVEAAAGEEVDEDVTIMSSEFDFGAPPPPPPAPPTEAKAPPVKKEDEIFVAFDTPPQPVRVAKPDYPEIARKSGLEGLVLLEVVIEKDGTVSNAKVLKSLQPGPDGCDEAAIEAALKSVFTPAKQRDKPVRVKITLPFRFTLNN